MDSDDVETLESRRLTSASLSDVRTVSTEAGLSAGLDEDRAHRFALAVHEVAANVVEHGGGAGELTVIRDDETVLIADISDAGPGMVVPDPIVRPAPDALRGRGLWLSQVMTDRMDVTSDASGTLVHLEMDLGKNSDRDRSEQE